MHRPLRGGSDKITNAPDSLRVTLAMLGEFVLPLSSGVRVCCVLSGQKMRECLGSSSAAEQRGADSCVTYILGACKHALG